MISKKDKAKILEMARGRAAVTVMCFTSNSGFWVVCVEKIGIVGLNETWPNLIEFKDTGGNTFAWLNLNQVDTMQNTRYSFVQSGNFLIETKV